MPEVNIYVPVTHTIMAKPKFMNYDKKDQFGYEFKLSDGDRYSASPATHMPTTLKPAPFSPELPSNLKTRAKYAHEEYLPPRRKWGMPYRINKTKRDKHLTLSGVPQVWRFSTFVNRGESNRTQEVYQPQSAFSYLYTYAKQFKQ
jgi:hypothetical protein